MKGRDERGREGEAMEGRDLHTDRKGDRGVELQAGK